MQAHSRAHQDQEHQGPELPCHYSGVHSLLLGCVCSSTHICQKEVEAFVKLPYISLGLRESRLSFKPSELLPDFSQVWVLILSDLVPRFSQVYLLPFRVDIWASTAHVLSKGMSPSLFLPSNSDLGKLAGCSGKLDDNLFGRMIQAIL